MADFVGELSGWFVDWSDAWLFFLGPAVLLDQYERAPCPFTASKWISLIPSVLSPKRECSSEAVIKDAAWDRAA